MAKLKAKFEIMNRIQVLRAERRISQEDLAKSISVTRATINSIEKANYNPSLELAFRLSKYFKIGIEEIFYIEKDSQK